MSFNAKEAAEKLFKIADIIEKQAAQKTFFVCDGCNHTASLESINSVRAKFASENQVESVASVCVDDVIACTACGGDMSYSATEESAKFFIEASSSKKSGDGPEDEFGVKEEDETDTKEHENAETPAEEDAEHAMAPEESLPVEDQPVEDKPVEEKKDKKTPTDKKDTDGAAELKEEPKVQFGDKKASDVRFEKAVARYSSF